MRAGRKASDVDAYLYAVVDIEKERLTELLAGRIVNVGSKHRYRRLRASGPERPDRHEQQRANGDGGEPEHRCHRSLVFLRSDGRAIILRGSSCRRVRVPLLAP